MSYSNTNNSSSSTGGDELYFPTNTDARRRLGRMEKTYSLNDPYGSLNIRPVVSNGAVTSFNPISAIYCPSTEKVYCGNSAKFIRILNPKKTGPIETSSLSLLAEDTTESNVSTSYDSEFIKGADSTNGSMSKAYTLLSNSEFSGTVEIKFSIRNDTENSPYYYGYKVTKNNASSVLFLSSVVTEGCYNENIDESLTPATPSTLENLASWPPTSYVVTAEISKGDSLELWVGGAMLNCASTGASSSSVTDTKIVHGFKVQALYEDSLENSIVWGGSDNYLRKDYIGNFTPYENRYYVDGAYSPINDKVYYAFNSKEGYETLSGGFGIAKIDPHTHSVETEIGLYNFDPVEGLSYTDANLSQMRNMLPLPKKLIYCPTNNKIYILHGDPIKSWVTVVNPLTDKVSGSFTHSSLRSASDIEYSSINDKIYVTNEAGYSISVINPRLVSVISEILPFVYDEWTKLLLHLDSNFSFVIPSGSSTSGSAVSMMGSSRILKDYVIGSLTETKDIDYKTNFLSGLNTKLDQEILSPDDDYSKRWKEKDFNKTQHNRVHTIFDGDSCQKIPYRPEWASCDSEFTIELWVKPDKDFFQARTQDGNGEYVIEKYDPYRSALQAGDPSTMLLFSIGNVHNSTHLCPDCKTGEAALALSLNTGRSYDDETRGGLTLHWGSGSKTYTARYANDSHLDHSHYQPHKPFGGGVIFDEWNHVALVKRPADFTENDSTEWSEEVDWDIFVNGHLFAGERSDSSAPPNFLMTRGYDDSRDTADTFFGDAEDRTLYIGGTAGSVKFRKIKEVDFEHNDILLENDDILPAASNDEYVNIYSNSHTYPSGVDKSIKYYLGDTNANDARWPRRRLHLNKDDAISGGDTPGIDLEHLKPDIQKKEFKYSARGEHCYYDNIVPGVGAFYECDSPSDYEETMIPSAGPVAEVINVFNHTITQEGTASINLKLKSCTDYDLNLEGSTLEIYKNNRLFQTVSLDNRFDGLGYRTGDTGDCTGIDINDSPVEIDCREGDVVFGTMRRPDVLTLGSIIVETIFEELPSKYDDLFLAYVPFQVGRGNLGTGHTDDLLSWPQWLKKNWMHYSGLMNGFRISNISRYDKEFRPLRFDDFIEDEHTVLLVDGSGKAKAKNDVIRYAPSMEGTSWGADDLSVLGLPRSDKTVLDTSNPSPGSIWPKANQRKEQGSSDALPWVEELDKKEPGASYRLPYGFRNDIHGQLLIIDDPGELIGAEGKDFSITAEINWLKYDHTDPDINYGIDKGIVIAHWESVKDITKPIDDYGNKCGYHFGVVKAGQAMLSFSYWTVKYGTGEYGIGLLQTTVCHIQAELNHEDLGNNKWNKFSAVRSEDATSISLYHNDQLLKTESTIYDSSGNVPDGWNAGDPIKPEHWVPDSWAHVNIHDGVREGGPQGVFSIGGGSTEVDFALGQYEIVSAGKQVFALDPNIASHHNQLGSVYSDLDGLSLYEMENVEIMSLGKPGDPNNPNLGWTKAGHPLPLNPFRLSSLSRKGYTIETIGSLFVDVGSPYSYDPLTTLGQDHQTSNGSRFYNVSASVEHGYAFFKGNNTTLPTPAAGQKLSYDLRYISSGSYIKHLPKLDYVVSGNEMPQGPIYGFDPDVSSLGNKNFVIECSIMPMKLPVSDSDTDTTVDTEMGVLCFNYDDLDNSSIDWSDCPGYVIDGNGNTRSQCENSPIDERTSWQSSGSNEGAVGWQLRIKSDGKADFKFGSQDRNTIPGNLDYFYDGEPRTLTSTSSLKYNKWYLLTVSRVGENVFLYINGTKEASINIGQETVLEHPINVGVSKYDKMGLLIGKSYDGGVTNSSSTPSYFVGLINEVRVRPSINNAHHTPYYGAPDSTLTFKENYVHKPFIDQSLAYHSPDDGKLYLDSVDYLHLNFNDFIRNSAPRGGGEFGLDSTKNGNFIGSGDLQTKSNYVTFDVGREGYVKIRDNDEEGVSELGLDGYIKVGGGSQLDLGENFVVEGWFLSDEDEKLISKTNSNCDGWNLTFKDHGLSFSITRGNDWSYTPCAEIKIISGGYPQTSRGKWNHFAIQLEDAQTISLMLNGYCVASGALSSLQYAQMNKDPNAGIDIGRNSTSLYQRSGTLFVDNIRATKEAVYKNCKKFITISGRPELLREPDVYHLHSKGIDYEKSKITDHSLKLKSNYTEGNAVNVVVDSVADFDDTEDFTIELFFRTDNIDDLSLGTSFLIERGSEWGASSDQGYYIGLETDEVTPGVKRSRLVARAGGVVLKAKENDSRSHEHLTEDVEGLAAHGGWVHCSGDSPPALYFYNIDDFISGSYEVGFNHVEDDYIIQKYKHVMLCRHTYAGIPYLSLFVDKRLVASNFEISSTSNSTTFIDSSGSAHTVTPSGGVHHSCEKSRVDNIETHNSGVSTSIKFDGADDYLTVPASSDFDFDTGDFTIEMWIRPNDSGANTYAQMFELYDSSTDRMYLRIERQTGFNRYDFTCEAAGTSTTVTSADGAPNYGNWQHLAVARNSGLITMYVDGVPQADTDTNTGALNFDSVLKIGAETINVTSWFSGYLDEIRISKGPENGARYTGTFTPQDTPFVPDGSTVLLIHSGDKPAHTYALTALGDNVDVSSWPITIGGDGIPSDSYFSGNMNLIKIERGTNSNLSTSYSDDWLKDRLKALSAARIQSGSLVLENQYGGIDGFHWATGTKLHNQAIYYKQEFGGGSSHASDPDSSHDISHLYYPDMDSWYVQGNTLRDSRMTNLPMGGGTEVFLDFGTQFIDGNLLISPNAYGPVASFRPLGDGYIADTQDSVFKGMYTPPTNLSAIYFGKISQATINKNHVSTVNYNDGLLAYDYKNNWNYMNEDFVMSAWVKPEDITNLPTIFYRESQGQAMVLRVGPGQDSTDDTTGQLLFEYHTDQEVPWILSDNTMVEKPGEWVLKSKDDVIKQNEWQHIAIAKERKLLTTTTPQPPTCAAGTSWDSPSGVTATGADATFIIDGNTGSYWYGTNTGSGTEMLNFDLGQEKCIDGLNWISPPDHLKSKGYSPSILWVKISLDNVNWTLVAGQTAPSWVIPHQTDQVPSQADNILNFTSLRGRYIEVYVQALPYGIFQSYATCSEFTAHTSSVPTTTTTVAPTTTTVAPTQVWGAQWTMYINGQEVAILDDLGGAGLQRWPMMDFDGDGAETLHIGKRPNSTGVTGNACISHEDWGSWMGSKPMHVVFGSWPKIIYWIWGCGGQGLLSQCYATGDEGLDKHDVAVLRYNDQPPATAHLATTFNGISWLHAPDGIQALPCPYYGLGRVGQGNPGGVLDFTATDSRDLEISNTGIESIFNKFASNDPVTTWECWFNTQSTDLQYLVCLNTGEHHYGLSINPDTGEIKLGGNIDGATALSTGELADRITLFEWHHIAVTVGGNQVSIFFDGERVAHTDSFIPPPGYTWGTMTIGSQHYIGNDVVDTGWRYFFKGYMTDIIFSEEEKYKIGSLPSIGGLNDFTGYMSEFLIATAPWFGAGYDMGRLDGRATSDLANEYETIFEKGARVIHPSDIKFLLNFDDYEDHSMDVDRGKPEPSENTILLLPFDKDEQDKSGEAGEITETDAQYLTLQHRKYEISAAEAIWWRNHAIKGRVWVGDYIVHGGLSITPDGQGNHAVAFPGNQKWFSDTTRWNSSYLELYDRKGTPRVIKADSTDLKGQCAPPLFERYEAAYGSLPINCPNSENYSLEFWFRAEGQDSLGNQYYNDTMIVPLIGGEKLNNDGSIATWFYVCLESTIASDGNPWGRVTVSKRDEWDAGAVGTNTRTPNDLITNTRLRGGGTYSGVTPPDSDYPIPLNDLQNSDFIHVYVCRKDGIWFLYLNGEHQDHAMEWDKDPRASWAGQYGYHGTGYISFDTWTVGGVTLAGNNGVDGGRYQQGFRTDMFRGKIDMIRELSGGVPYNPIKFKGLASVGTRPDLPNLEVETDLTTLSDFPKKVAGSNYWDRTLEEVYCVTSDPPPPLIGTGACCSGYTGIAGQGGCSDGVDASNCAYADSAYLGDNTTCANDAARIGCPGCGPDYCGGGGGGSSTIGACCYWFWEDIGNDEQNRCIENTEFACYELGAANIDSTWHGAGSSCLGTNPGTYTGGDCLGNDPGATGGGGAAGSVLMPCPACTEESGYTRRSNGDDCCVDPRIMFIVAQMCTFCDSTMERCAADGCPSGGSFGLGEYNPCLEVGPFRPACCDDNPPCYGSDAGTCPCSASGSGGPATPPVGPPQTAGEGDPPFPFPADFGGIGQFYGSAGPPLVGMIMAPLLAGYAAGGVFVAPCPACTEESGYTRRSNGDDCCVDPRIMFIVAQMCTFCDSTMERCATDGCPSGPGACTTDVFQCPDGSSVDRDPNDNCNFFPCPNPEEATTFCTIQLFPFEPESQAGIEHWTNEKSETSTVLWAYPSTSMFSNFWKISGDLNRHLVVSDTCPVIDSADHYIGVGSGLWDGTCYSILEDSSGWDFGQDDFTVEFWYKKEGRGVYLNDGPFHTNGTCVVARQGYGFNSGSLGWSTELSYVKQDLATLFMYYRLKHRSVNHIDSIGSSLTPLTPPSEWQADYENQASHLHKKEWENSIIELGSPEMRFSFSIDNGYIKPFDNSPTASAITGTNGGIHVMFTLSWGSPRNDTWEHYAIVRSGQTFRTFKNGKIIDEISGDQPVLRYDEDLGDTLGAGQHGDGKFNIKTPENSPMLSIAADTKFINKNWLLQGHIDELRISKGIARYTEEFELGGVSVEGAVESTISTTQKTAAITYCPIDDMLYAFTASTGEVYQINPRNNSIMNTATFSSSDPEQVKESYFCPINNTILVSSYDGLYKLYSFLPKGMKINQTFNVQGEGGFTYAGTTNKIYYACENYIYEIGD